MDNAGGSQVLSTVIDSIERYLKSTNVQLGASYPVAQKSTSAYNEGVLAAAKYINADPACIVIGPSTTQLFRNLSIALKYPPGSELVISLCDHEANIASWVQIARWRNLKVIWWKPSNSKTNPKLIVSDLEKLLTDKTRLVACTHTSNILGSITDIKSIAEAVHKIPGALLCVDAVAYAPHGPIDVQALGVDFYSFSWYKLFGPHIAVLYASESAQKELESLGHYFKEGKNMEEILGLAGANYECVQSIPHVTEYLGQVGWEGMMEQEERIQEVLLSYLRSQPEKITIYGDPSSDRSVRVPVISFGVRGWKSFDVIDEVEKRSKFGCRPGHFYSKRLCDEVLGLEDSEDGVVRCSLLHYNTVEEVEGLVKVLKEVIGSGKESSGQKQSTEETKEWVNK